MEVEYGPMEERFPLRTGYIPRNHDCRYVKVGASCSNSLVTMIHLCDFEGPIWEVTMKRDHNLRPWGNQSQTLHVWNMYCTCIDP